MDNAVRELWGRALVAREEGRPDDALRHLSDLLARHTDHLPALHLLGVVHSEAGRYHEATHLLRRVCSTESANDEAWSNLGNALLMAGELDAAESALRSGLVINSENPLLHFNLGAVLQDSDRADEAEACYRRASELDPDDPEAWLRVGLLCYRRSAYMDAAAAFKRASLLDGPHRRNSLRLHGFALTDGGFPGDAEPILAALVEGAVNECDDFHLLSQLLYCRLELCDWSDLGAVTARYRQFVAKEATAVEPFTFLLMPDVSAQEQLQLTANFVQHFVSRKPLSSGDGTHENPVRRLRLGYLSADFHSHATAYLLTGILENHDHRAFAVHAFSYGPPDDSAYRQRIVAACDVFHDISGLSRDAKAQQIRAENLDILVDLKGWTGDTCSSILARRLAPVQVNWLGYPGTLGNRQLADYLIGDPIITPLANQHHFAETIAQMPHCYQPNDNTRLIEARPKRAAENLLDDSFVFCCFNRTLKITPRIFACWCEILNANSNSILWLLETNPQATKNLRNEAARHHIDQSRLVFARPVPPAKHLARIALADLFLDTHPYGAHTTASDALWAGVPVLTLAGETFQSRVAASLLEAVGLPELVTHSLDDYRNLALELTRRPDFLRDLRERLAANRLSSPLFDTKRFARDLEALLRVMWGQYCTGIVAPIPALAEAPEPQPVHCDTTNTHHAARQ